MPLAFKMLKEFKPHELRSLLDDISDVPSFDSEDVYEVEVDGDSDTAYVTFDDGSCLTFYPDKITAEVGDYYESL